MHMSHVENLVLVMYETTYSHVASVLQIIYVLRMHRFPCSEKMLMFYVTTYLQQPIAARISYV